MERWTNSQLFKIDWKINGTFTDLSFLQAISFTFCVRNKSKQRLFKPSMKEVNLENSCHYWVPLKFFVTSLKRIVSFKKRSWNQFRYCFFSLIVRIRSQDNSKQAFLGNIFFFLLQGLKKVKAVMKALMKRKMEP